MSLPHRGYPDPMEKIHRWDCEVTIKMRLKQSTNSEIAAPRSAGLAMTIWLVFLLTSSTLKGYPAMKSVDENQILGHLQRISGERTPHSSDRHLDEVMNYIQHFFKKLGYQVKLHPFPYSGETFHNIIARKNSGKSSEKIIIGAHFDSVLGSPGADDNASGAAVMLELARILAEHTWNHEVEFVGFHMEEWNMIGSGAYAQKLKNENQKVRGMISLEMVGYTSNEPKSQKMPLGFSLFYPEVGNFIALIGNLRSIKLLNLFKSEMKSVRNLPVESLAIPFNGNVLPAVRLSDHAPFWDLGYPALLITDTSFYRNPNYHTASDAIETLDLKFMARVAEATAKALIALDEK